MTFYWGDDSERLIALYDEDGVPDRLWPEGQEEDGEVPS